MNNKKVLAILSSSHSVTHLVMGIVSVTLPAITRELGATYTQVGLMRTTQALAAGASSAVGGVAADLVKKRKALLLLSMIWPSFFVFLGAFSPTFFFFALCLVLRDLMGGFLWHPPAMAAIAELFPTRKAFGFSVHEAGGNIGYSIGPLIAGLLLAYVSWRILFQGYLFLGLATALLLWLFLPSLAQVRRKERPEVPFRQAISQGIVRDPRFVAIAFASGMRGAAEQLLTTFLPLYLAYNLNKGAAMIGLFLFTQTMAATLSAPLVGELSDRTDRRLVIFLFMSLGGTLTYLITLAESNLFIFALSALLGITLFNLRSLIISFATDHTPPEIAGTAIGFIFTFDRVFAAALPLISGYLGDLYGLKYAMYFLSACIILGGMVTRMVPRAEPTGPPGFISPLEVGNSDDKL